MLTTGAHSLSPGLLLPVPFLASALSDRLDLASASVVALPMGYQQLFNLVFQSSQHLFLHLNQLYLWLNEQMFNHVPVWLRPLGWLCVAV